MSLNTIRKCYHMQSILESMKTEEVQIFIRQEILRFYQFLNDYNLIVVTGSPGIGKSISSWMWLCDQIVLNPNLNVIWVNTVSNLIFFIKNDRWNEIWKDARRYNFF